MRLVTSDGELIQRAATGDRSAFEDLYRRYARPVFGLALRRLGDRGRAEDAVQETFASIWRSAGSYRPDRGPGAPAGLRRRCNCDRRPRARVPTARGDPGGASREGDPLDRAEQSWVTWRVHRALEVAGARARSDRARVLERPLAVRERSSCIRPGTVNTDTRH
jgi:RNA polymerase sigma-70 factor (ECF subfamily)